MGSSLDPSSELLDQGAIHPTQPSPERPISKDPMRWEGAVSVAAESLPQVGFGPHQILRIFPVVVRFEPNAGKTGICRKYAVTDLPLHLITAEFNVHVRVDFNPRSLYITGHKSRGEGTSSPSRFTSPMSSLLCPESRRVSGHTPPFALRSVALGK